MFTIWEQSLKTTMNNPWKVVTIGKNNSKGIRKQSYRIMNNP